MDGVIEFDGSARGNTCTPKQLGAENRVVSQQESQCESESVFIATRQTEYALDWGGDVLLVILTDVKPHCVREYGNRARL